MTDVVWVCSPPTVATANGSGNPKMKPGQSTPPSAEPPPPQRMKRRTEDIAFVKTVYRDNCSHKKQSAIRRGSGEPAASRLGAGDDSLTRDPEIWLAAIQVQVSIFEIKSNGRSARKCLRGGGKYVRWQVGCHGGPGFLSQHTGVRKADQSSPSRGGWRAHPRTGGVGDEGRGRISRKKKWVSRRSGLGKRGRKEEDR